MTQVHPVVCGPAAFHNDHLSRESLKNEKINQTQATSTILRKSGDIQVDNDVARLTHTKYKYLKLDSDTNTLEWDKIKRWGLKEPNTLICVTGERETSNSPGDLTESLRSLLNFASRADAWIITGESNTDFKKRLWETALEYGMFPSGRIPILDIVSADRVASGKKKCETMYRVNTAGLDLYHTHIVLIDNTSQQTSLEVEFCQRFLTGMFNRDKSCLMIFLVLGGDLESVGNAFRISTPNIFLRGSGGDDDITVLENGPGTDTNHKEFPKFLTLCKLDIFKGSDSEVEKKLFQAWIKAKRINGKELIKLVITWNNMDFLIEEMKTKKTNDFQLQKPDQLEILEFAIVYNRVQLVQVMIDNGVNVNEISELQTHLYTKANLKNMTTVKNVAAKAEKDELTEMVSFVKKLEKRLKKAPKKSKLPCQAAHFFFFWSLTNDKMKLARIFLKLHQKAPSDLKNKSKLPCQAAHFFFFWSLTNDRMELARIFFKLHQEPIAAYLQAADVLKQLGKENKKFEKIGINIVNRCYKQDEEKTLDLLSRKLNCCRESTCLNIALASRNKLFISQPVCMSLMKKCWYGKIGKGSSYISIGVSTIIFPAIFCAVKFDDKTNDSHNSRSDATHYEKLSSKLKLFYTAPVVIFILNCLSQLAFLGLYSYMLVVVFSPNYHVIEGIVFFWVLTITMEEIRQIYTLSKQKGYFGNKWNWLDIAIIIGFNIGLVLRFIPKSECFETSRVLFSLNLIFFFLRFLHTLSATRTLGPMLTMIWKMFGILIKFLFILMTFIAAYAIASEAILYPETQLSWKLLYYLPRRAYWHLYGELFLDDMEGQSSCTNDPAMYSNYTETRCPSELGKVVGPILMGIYVLLSNILLMNLLIALLSYEIQKVYDNANNHWSFQRLNLIQEYRSRPVLPPPFIIFNHVYLLIKLICEKDKPSKDDEELARWERCMVMSCVDKINTDSSEEHLKKKAKCEESKSANQDAEVHLKDNENEDNKARNNTKSEIQAISSGISELREEIKLLKENMNNTNQIQQNQFSEFSRVINMLKTSVDELTTRTALQIPPPAVYSPPDKSFLETRAFLPPSPLQVQNQDAPLMQEEINQVHRSEEMGRESGPGSITSYYQVLPPIQPDRTDSNV